MQTQTELSFFTLVLLISFASVNAVLFTPALPDITNYFSISSEAAHQTITLFLIGYALGQLLYGPIANRFGRKPALYVGISLQILSSLLCILAAKMHEFTLLLFARFMLALGSGVGFNMTFTLVTEYYSPKIASQKIAYLMIPFAISSGLSIAVGGILTTYYGWISCFYAGALYGLILLLCIRKIPETNPFIDKNALQLKVLFHSYWSQFKNTRLIAGGFLMGSTTCFIYVFAAIAPFVEIELLKMGRINYGMANVLPALGLMLGGLISAKLTQSYLPISIIKWGVIITSVGVGLISIASFQDLPALFSLFLPMVVIYFGLAFIFANTSVVVLYGLEDKAHASALLSFITLGWATLVVLNVGFLPINYLTLHTICTMLCSAMIGIYLWFVRKSVITTTSRWHK